MLAVRLAEVAVGSSRNQMDPKSLSRRAKVGAVVQVEAAGQYVRHHLSTRRLLAGSAVRRSCRDSFRQDSTSAAEGMMHHSFVSARTAASLR